MKDLYTFDASIEDALQTYEAVRRAYVAFFDEFKIPYLTAEASSGEIGGDLSHEYHFPTSKGEDRVISCTSCDYVANEELAESRLTRQGGFSTETDPRLAETDSEGDSFTSENPVDSSVVLEPNEEGEIDLEISARRYGNQWIGITGDRNTIVQAFLPKEIHHATSSQDRKAQINPFVIKDLVPDLDLSVESPLALFKEHRRQLRESGEDASVEARVLRLVDMRYYLYTPISFQGDLPDATSVTVGGQEIPVEKIAASENDSVDLVRMETGDPCPNCEEGTLKIDVAVELGHTFHLGTRYSEPLSAIVVTNRDSKQEDGGKDRAATASTQVPIQMGCHGIGVSRLIAAVADSLADYKGLNWPTVMAPFHTVIVPTKGQQNEAVEVYDLLTTNTNNTNRDGNMIDTILDDRTKDFGWKLRDADMIGYPVIVVVGREWKKERKVEVQCRRLGLKEQVPSEGLRAFVEGLLAQL
jgi:prolyl-tRNA synthetase